jgi:hypothetical protein
MESMAWLRDGEFSDLPFLARGKQVRLGVGEGRIVLVELGRFCGWFGILDFACGDEC